MFRSRFVIVIFLTLVCHVFCHKRIDPLVETKEGLLRGVRAEDGNYSMFLGIPYATVNKDNPFGVSTPQSKFDTIFEANNESSVCPQFADNGVIGTLDCLHLNIFVPNKASTTNYLPVLVWIYGGRFERGNYQTTRLNPRHLIEHDIIVVTFNYRTGPYGFMCLDTPEVPGNAGLKDQLIALKWIKNNIQSFGGDVDQITLGGQSAGAVSVDFHLLYDKEIYFNRALMNSGTANCPWAIINSDRNEPIQLARILGYETDEFKDALSFLSKADPAMVTAAKQELSTVSRACVEKTFDGVENFITDYPFNIQIPRARTTPIFVGYNDDELIGEYIKFPESFFEDQNLFSDEMSIVFDFGNYKTEMGDFYKHFYVGDVVGIESQLKIIDFESDLRFNYAIHESIKSYLANDAKNIYHFIFSYVGERNMKLINNVTVGGASHGDELPYVFDYAIFKDKPLSARDQVMTNRLTTLFANFIKYGDPTPVPTELLPVKWTPVTPDSFNYLNIDFEMKMDTRPFHERHTFWDIFYKLNEKARRGYKGK